MGALSKGTRWKFSGPATMGFVWALMVSAPVFSQDEYGFGTLPALRYSHDFSDVLSMDLNAESRHFFHRGVFGEDASNSEYEFDRIDLNAMLSRKLNSGNHFEAGYLFRHSGGSSYHRLIQAYGTKSDALNLEHRFAAEQIYGADSKPEYRFRYKLTHAWSLFNREDSEVALKTATDHLYGFSGGETEYEVRLGTTVVFPLFGSGELGVGPEYRVSPVNKSDKKHQFLLAISYAFGG